MMPRTIGLLTDNNELIDDFESQPSGFAVRTYKALEAVKPDEIIVLAVDADFFESTDTIQFFLSKIRKKLQGLPVLLIMRISILPHLNFEWFFDEFVLYPFRKGEISARLKRIFWDKAVPDNENIITIGKIKINLKEYTVHLNDEKLDFTYKEFELLRFLTENRGVVFSRKDLLNKIWGVEYIGGTRTVDVHIRRLRGKLGEEFNSVIETVRNVGYRCMS
ncbi:MAG TPA: response regulator transcription factor [Spirochaetota bacterium]|nr:response regulator transcription factor [Spirochaetota bacterium]HQO01695.1 response regulator transcription factor [Spirochaetota bacterium]HQP48712.1 response regulator transcription factor [Spirochaetota bacterium]